VLVLLWAAAGLLLASGGCGSSGGAPNVPSDSDGDGLPDRVTVGDFDGDGILEMDDLQDAVDALTDPGSKTVTVQAGEYLAPGAPGLRPGRVHALLELPSHITLRCAGVGATVLHGTPPGAGSDYAVLANRDFTNGNTGIWIRDCEIHGGMPESYRANTFARTQRMGVFFRRTRDSRVTDSHVHHTAHTGLYTSNSRGDQFLRNVVEDAGGWGDTTASGKQPCIYLYAIGGDASLSDFQAVDNTLRRCGFAGLNTRAEDTDAPGTAIRNLLWERNSVEQTKSQCISLRGVEGGTVRDLSCRLTGSVILSRGAGTGYRSSGNDNANSNLTIEDVVMSEVSLGPALDVGAWVDGLTIRRFSVEGTRDATGASVYRDCARLERPLRNAVLEDVELRDCGRAGLVVSALSPSTAAEETLTLRRVAIHGVDRSNALDGTPSPGLHFQGPHARLRLEDLDLAAATGPELLFDSAVSDAALLRVTIDSVDPGWLGAFPEAAVPDCTTALAGHWLTTLDGSSGGDCAFAAGTGSTPARCGCAAGAWAPLGSATAPGIEFASGVLHTDVWLEDVTVANARAVTGVRVGGVPSAFSVTTLLGLDDSLATDIPQRSAIDFETASGWSVTGVTCIGTQPEVPCVE
jgi:hypothetical protein